MKRQSKIMQWMMDHINEQNDNCLIWPFSSGSDGYPKAGIGKTTYSAARLMCEHANGPAPTAKHQTAHSCNNGPRGCVNPRHLRWATAKENIADKKKFGTQTKGRNHPRAKLTETDVLAIFAARLESPKSLAQKFSISPATVYAIWKQENWRWLTGEPQ